MYCFIVSKFPSRRLRDTFSVSISTKCIVIYASFWLPSPPEYRGRREPEACVMPMPKGEIGLARQILFSKQNGMNTTERARAIWQAGVDAVQGDRAVISQLSIENDCLIAGDTLIPLADFDRVLVVGGGKATASMAAGLVRAIGDQVELRGRINVPVGTARGLDLGDIQVCEARPPGMNEPTELAVAGTEAILADVASASPRDLCITLISGGGSALLVAPPPGISLANKLAVTRHLSSSGASIHELNTVRKRLSRIKGGGLLRANNAGRMLTLVLSDVIGDPLDIIASGPTVADTAAPGDALAVLRKFDPNRTLPAAIHRRLSLRESSVSSLLSRS